jgi:hypothetical protein
MELTDACGDESRSTTPSEERRGQPTAKKEREMGPLFVKQLKNRTSNETHIIYIT